MGKKQQLDIGRRGSPSWAFNRLREDALAQLLNDLYSVEDQGLTPEQCKLVADAIAKVVNYATAIPDGSFLSRPIWVILQKFENAYRNWNEPKGVTPQAIQHRRNHYFRLRKIRHKIARRTRKNLAVIDKELDIKLVEDTYKALGNLVSAGPDIFKNLAKAVSRFTAAAVSHSPSR